MVVDVVVVGLLNRLVPAGVVAVVPVVIVVVAVVGAWGLLFANKLEVAVVPVPVVDGAVAVGGLNNPVAVGAVGAGGGLFA